MCGFFLEGVYPTGFSTEWSHDLLEAEEQLLFRRLAVFRGGFSLEAAEFVCGAALDTIESLVVKSLVRRWGSGRLGLLDTIREYAAERLDASPEAEDIRRRHAEFFLTIAEAANLNPSTVDPRKPIRHDIATREQDEMFGALAWALQSGSVTLGLRLATTVGGWLWSIGDPREGLRYFERLLERQEADGVPAEILAEALREYGAMADLAGEADRATPLYEQSLALFEQLGNEQRQAVLLHRIGNQAMLQGHLARELIQTSHSIHERNDDQWGLAQTLGTLGAIVRDEGDDEVAYELVAQSATIAREVGHTGFVAWWTCGMLAELVALSLKARRIEETEAHARESLALVEELRYRAGRVFAIGVLACVAAERGELESAGLLWGAIEDEDAGAPLGGWRRHRQECEGRIRELAGPEFDRGRAKGRALTLDNAVSLALGTSDDGARTASPMQRLTE